MTPPRNPASPIAAVSTADGRLIVAMIEMMTALIAKHAAATLPCRAGAVGEIAAGQHAGRAGAEKGGQRDIGGRECHAIAAHQRDDAEIADAGIGQAEQHEEDRQHDDRRRDDALPCAAGAPSVLRSAELASGMPTAINSSATTGPTAPATISAPRPADGRHQRGHDRRRHRAAEEAGKGVDRKRAAHPRFVHMRRQDRVIAGMIDAVGEARAARRSTISEV